MDKLDKDEVLGHFGEMLAEYTDMVILGVTGISVETRAIATNRAAQLIVHIREDLVTLLKSEEKSELGEDFQMWANEFKQS